jgi:predicted Zn finger-like uncharacterized protein
LLIDIHKNVVASLTFIQRFSGKPVGTFKLRRIAMSVLLAQRPKKTYQRGAVVCEKCATPIYVYKLKALPDEFSVRCPHCGSRGIYLKRAIAIEEVPERRKKQRK